VPGLARLETLHPELAPGTITSLASDLILLDLRFGRDDGGIDFLARLQTDPVTMAIPVLVCSADHQLLARFQDQFVTWGYGVLSKPFGLEALLAAIQGLLLTPPSDGPRSSLTRRPARDMR
jgi:CheY-like chemotaxis protein